MPALQVMSLHSTPVAAGGNGPTADPPSLQGGPSQRPALERRVSFRDGGPPVPGVLTWRPPSSRSTNDLLAGGVPSGSSPYAHAMLPALSAEYSRQLPAAPDQALNPVRSAFADAASAPMGSQQKARTAPAPASAAEVEMVEHAADGSSQGAQSNGLHMPRVVAEWFKTASFRNEAARGSARAQPEKDVEGGGDFTDSMPLEFGRNRRRQQ